MDELRPGTAESETPAGTLGDIVLCPQVAAKQAIEAGHSAVEEMLLLTTHGILHLLGYDHAEPQEKKENVRPSTHSAADLPRGAGPVSGTPVALLIVLAIIVLAFGAVLTAGETALMRMTRAAAEDLVQDQRRGAGRVLALAEKRGQVLGSVAPIRVAVNMLAAVLLTLAASGLLDRWWQVLVVAVVLNIVLLGLVVGFSPRSVGRRHPDGHPAGPGRRAPQGRRPRRPVAMDRLPLRALGRPDRC